MKTLIAAVAVSLSSLVALAGAEGTNGVITLPNGTKLTPVQIQKMLRDVGLRKTGGEIRRAGSAKGVFVILNAQKTVPAKDLLSVCDIIDESVCVQTAVKEIADGVTCQNARALIEKNGGTVGVAVVDVEGFPTLLTAPESGWAIVNVKALSADGPELEKLRSRARKELLRAFAHATGGACAARAPIVMRDVANLSDLDAIPRENYGIEVSHSIGQSALAHGLRPWIRSTYRRACSEGWAPAPTNEYQKAIWDEVHKLPSDPIKIKYDPKRDK